MKTLTVKTKKKKQIIDITDQVNDELDKLSSNGDGICHLFVTHTTAALTTADLDPGTDLDMLDAFQEMIPKLDYRHPHNPKHVPDHILTSLIGTSLAVPVVKGSLRLGTWQRVILVELDGPRDREVVINV
jgi:secondary thiamine-phosphate synthase enzyme